VVRVLTYFDVLSTFDEVSEGENDVCSSTGDKDDAEDEDVTNKFELELLHAFVNADVGGTVTNVIGITLLGLTIMAAASLPTKSKLKFEFEELLFPL